MLCVWKKVYEHNADEKEILEYITNEHEAEVDVSLEFPGFFYDPMDVNNLISDSSAFSKLSLNNGNSRFMYCWSLCFRITVC